jgi:DnaJ like chaperone protein
MSPVLIGQIVGMVAGYLLARHWIGGVVGFFAGGWLVQEFRAGQTRGAGMGLGAKARERQKVFFESVFLTMGHLAKADGRVSEQEIQAARVLMHQLRLGPEDVRAAIELFTRGKRTDFPLESQMQRLGEACRGQPELIRAFLETLLEMPLGTGGIKPREREVLWRAAAALGVGRVEMAQLEALVRARAAFGQQRAQAPSPQQDLQEAYKALGIERGATDKEVKTAYRRLMNQHHPDKLVAKGLPESMMEAAKERTREIRAAYELIRDHRGIK